MHNISYFLTSKAFCFTYAPFIFTVFRQVRGIDRLGEVVIVFLEHCSETPFRKNFDLTLQRMEGCL